MARKGIIIDELTGDIDLNVQKTDGIITGGMLVANSDAQNIDIIVTMAKGELKEKPAIGVGILRFLKSTSRLQEMVREVKLQLELDGYKSADVRIVGGQLKIETT